MPRRSSRRFVTIHQAVTAGVNPAVIRTWVRRAAAILGLPAGTINLAFVSPAASQTLNHRYRRKRRPTNVLSFPYRPAADGVIGELVLCPAVIREEAPRSKYRSRLRFLVEHGLIHLHGLDHRTQREQRRWVELERQLVS